MDRRFKYKWYLAVLCLFTTIVVHGQYSEKDLLVEASGLFAEGKYAEAMPLYSQLLSLNPTKPDFNYHYGATALYGDASKKEEAIKYLRYASTKEGIDPMCWYFLGRAYHLNYQFADAINAYNTFIEKGSKKEVEPLSIEREIESCRNGQNLLSNIKEVVVLDKKQSAVDAFFRIYDLTDIGGKILVTPEELLSPLDIKNNHKSLIHFRGTGTVVYFSSYGKDGKNGLDIYRADVLPGGTFSAPVELGGFVNTPFDEDFPFMHPDDKTFYFSSKGHSSMGGYDIFQSAYDQGLDVFSKPENLDFAVNTPDDELLYIADSAKMVANFASARSSKQGELHVYKVEVYSAPVDLTLIKGTFDNQVDTKDNLAKITVIDASNNLQVDIQYTDPVTGAYLLSFPRSGKFKFLVEASNSKQVHAGIVEIPSSSGVNAYLQEMDLVSSAGTEKLLINNLFDQHYQGDIAVLAQKLLKQKAALDVNFYPEQEAIPLPVEDTQRDIADAAHAAGFAIGFSNESILDEAVLRNNELNERSADIAELRLGAIETYLNNLDLANQKTAELELTIEKANNLPQGEQGEVFFRAGLLKMQAEVAILEAQNALALSEELEKLKIDVDKTLVASEEQSNYLKSSLESGDFETALNALKTEKAWDENNTSAYTNYDVLDLTQSASIHARNEAQSYLDRASKMRSGAEEIESELITKNRQREVAKGKRAKELDAEIARLETEYQDISEAADKAFDRAESFESVALNKRHQYNIVVGLTETLLEDNADFSQVDPGLVSDGDELAVVADKLSGIGFDKSAVSEYLKANPEALNDLGDDMAVLAFRQEYAKGAGVVNDGDLAADTGAVGGGAPTGSQTSNGEPNDEDVTAVDTGSDVTNSESDQTMNSEDLAISESEGKTADNLNGTEQTTEAESNQSSSNAEVVVPIIVPEISNDKETTIADSDIPEDNATDIGEVQSTPLVLDNYTDMSQSEMISADEAAITASKDWVSIIEGSITEIESIPASERSQEDEDQLRQFNELKASKEAEIIARETRINEWKSGDADLVARDDSDSQPEDTEIFPENNTVDNDATTTNDSAFENDAENNAPTASPLTRAENQVSVEEALDDLGELDTAYLTRLESKIPSTFTDRRYMGQIQGLDKSYLAAMSEVELSGKSDPEIAADRISLNETLIGLIDSALDDNALSQDKKDMLLELRRIKAVEITQDLDIESGDLAYTPRTTEGGDAMAADRAEQFERALYDPSKIEGLSPEMHADLSVDYSRDLVLEGYEANLSSIEETNSETQMKADRMALNNAYLTALQGEIQLYSEAVKTVDSSSPNAVNKRYEELLAERSAVIDEINTDKTFIAFAEAAAIAEGEVEETELVHNYVAEFDTLYLAEMEAINARGLEPEAYQRAMAEVNTNLAGGIDLAISTLTLELDETTSEERRDAIQIEIQTLDAVAADKRQEADRLNALANDTALATENRIALVEEENNQDSAEEISDKPSTDAETNTVEPVAQPDIETLRADLDLEPVDLKEVNYKSLNANIALNTMKPLVASTNEKKAKAQLLLSEYDSATDPEEQARIAFDLADIQKEIILSQELLTKELANSNAPEIAYYQEANQEMIATIQTSNLDVVDDEQRALLTEEAASINTRLSQNNAKFERGEISEIKRVENETAILTDLAELNTELIAVDERITEAILSTSTPEEIAEMDADEASLYSERIPSSIQFMVRQPENLLAKGNNEYVSPVLEEVMKEMTDDQEEAHVNADERLEVETDFVNSNEQDLHFELLETATAVDARGLNLLADSPEQLNYLIAAVRADSIGQLEKAQAEYSNELILMSTEELAEVRRLRKAMLVETDDSQKESMALRADRIEISAIDHYERGAIAAKRAEELRVMRQSQEKMLGVLAQEISYDQKRELDAILSHETYKVIPSDLASQESGERPERPITTDETESEPASVEENNTDSRPASDSNISANLPVKGSGNWIKMVEVIAEKSDFSDVDKTMFVQVDAPVYNDRRPIPIDPEMPSGLIFQVQVGAFRKPIPQDLFAQFAPVMGQKLDNGITRYRAGIFKIYKEAVDARDIIRTNGYTDAFVVVYLDGEKLSGAQVQDILAQAKTAIAAEDLAENAETAPSSAPSSNNGDAEYNNSNEETLNPESGAYYNDPEAAEAAQVEVTPGLFFTVQVGVYSKPVKLDALYNLTQLNSELTASGVIRYTTGRFATVAEASSHKTLAREKGVSDAFVTAYYNGKRISLDQAMDILETEGNSAISPSVGSNVKTNSQSAIEAESDFKYVVIIGSFVGDIPQDLANIFLVRDDLKIRRIEGPGGSSIYLSEEYTSEEEAKMFLSLCKQAGMYSAMMGKMKDGKVVSMNEE